MMQLSSWNSITMTPPSAEAAMGALKMDAEVAILMEAPEYCGRSGMPRVFRPQGPRGAGPRSALVERTHISLLQVEKDMMT
jgi:hypothetical protein